MCSIFGQAILVFSELLLRRVRALKKEEDEGKPRKKKGEGKRKNKGLISPQILIENFRLPVSRLEFSSFLSFFRVPLEALRAKKRETRKKHRFSHQISLFGLNFSEFREFSH